jgi:hypothetical protein
MDLPLQRADCGKPNSDTLLIIFPHFPLETGSVIFSGKRLPAIG